MPASNQFSSVSLREWMVVGGLTAFIVAVTGLPYEWAYSVRDGHIFDGFLFGLPDNHSYIAKMRQGFNGAWLFRLPYTADAGPGVFLYSYYLFLGHLASWIHVSNLQLVYHTARLLNSVVFLLLAYRFIAHFVGTPRQRLCVWLLFTLGSGLGWITSWFGMPTADLWIAEAFPFLTIFSYAHFPLVWALTLWTFELTLPGLSSHQTTWSRMGLIALAVSLLAQVAPMMLLVIGVVLCGLAGWRQLTEQRSDRAELMTIGALALFAAPWILYYAWVMRSHADLAGWSAQNVTQSPPVLDLIVAGGVPLLLAVIGGAYAARRRNSQDMALLVWIVLNAALLYMPFSLQRRLILGLWMPIAILAGRGLLEVIWPRLSGQLRPLLLAGVVVAVIGSNALVFGASINAIQQRWSEIFLTEDEAASFDWLEASVSPDKVVVASPQTAMRIPARSNGRVLYGHKYETVAADARKQEVVDFYSGQVAPDRFLSQHRADYVYFGPNERSLGSLPLLGEDWYPVFQQGNVIIFGK